MDVSDAPCKWQTAILKPNMKISLNEWSKAKIKLTSLPWKILHCDIEASRENTSYEFYFASPYPVERK